MTIKTFAQFVLDEELNPNQKDMVNRWVSKGGGKKAVEISKHVIPKGEHKMVLPLEEPHDRKIEPHPDVVDALHQHGYKVQDYASGFATDKYDRQVKIGKVLTKIGATDVLKTFTNDPNRDASRVHHDLQVVVSRHPHDVAGMSTNKGWTSCMRLPTEIGMHDGGSNEKYVPHDIYSGTHVAYLTKRGDDNLTNPVARIALKPWVSTDGKHTTLRPEDRTYGTPGGDAFSHTVNKFVNEHFKPQPGKFYRKDSDVYDDTGQKDSLHYDQEHLASNPKAISHLMKTVSPDALGWSGLRDVSKPENLPHMLKGTDAWRYHAVANYPGHFSEAKRLNLALKDPLPAIRGIAASHGTEKTFHKFLDNETNDTALTWSRSSNRNYGFTDRHETPMGEEEREHIMASHPNPAAALNIAKKYDRYSSPDNEIVSKLAARRDPKIMEVLHQNNHLQSYNDEHMEHLSNTPGLTGELALQAYRHTKDPVKHLQGAQHESSDVRAAVAQNLHADPKHAAHMLHNDPDEHVREEAFGGLMERTNRNVDEENAASMHVARFINNSPDKFSPNMHEHVEQHDGSPAIHLAISKLAGDAHPSVSHSMQETWTGTLEPRINGFTHRMHTRVIEGAVHSMQNDPDDYMAKATLTNYMKNSLMRPQVHSIIGYRHLSPAAALHVWNHTPEDEQRNFAAQLPGVSKEHIRNNVDMTKVHPEAIPYLR